MEGFTAKDTESHRAFFFREMILPVIRDKAKKLFFCCLHRSKKFRADISRMAIIHSDNNEKTL